MKLKKERSFSVSDLENPMGILQFIFFVCYLFYYLFLNFNSIQKPAIPDLNT